MAKEEKKANPIVEKYKKQTAALSAVNVIALSLIVFGLLYIFNDLIPGSNLDFFNLAQLLDHHQLNPTETQLIQQPPSQPRQPDQASDKSEFPVLEDSEQIKESAIGTLKDASGEVHLSRINNGLISIYAPKIGNYLLKKDKIFTGLKGKAQIILNNQSVIYIGENSRIELSNYSEADSLFSSLVSLINGKIRAFVGKSTIKRDVRILTTHTVMGVRGTDFVVTFDEKTEKSSVATISGMVKVIEIPQIKTPALALALASAPNIFQHATTLEPNQQVLIDQSAQTKSPDTEDLADNLAALMKITNQKNNSRPLKPIPFKLASLGKLLAVIHNQSFTPQNDLNLYRPTRKNPVLEPATVPELKSAPEPKIRRPAPKKRTKRYRKAVPKNRILTPDRNRVYQPPKKKIKVRKKKTQKKKTNRSQTKRPKKKKNKQDFNLNIRN